MAKAIVKRFANGQYELHINDRVFEIEDHKKVTDGAGMAGWMVYERLGDKREYQNDFDTKRAAIAKTIAAVDSGY